LMRLSGLPEILELGPQPDRLVAPAELPPLSALSPPDDPPTLPCEAGVALSGGDCEQVSLSFSG
jgi:hypothetical protein